MSLDAPSQGLLQGIQFLINPAMEKYRTELNTAEQMLTPSLNTYMQRAWNPEQAIGNVQNIMSQFLRSNIVPNVGYVAQPILKQQPQLTERIKTLETPNKAEILMWGKSKAHPAAWQAEFWEKKLNYFRSQLDTIYSNYQKAVENKDEEAIKKFKAAVDELNNNYTEAYNEYMKVMHNLYTLYQASRF